MVSFVVLLDHLIPTPQPPASWQRVDHKPRSLLVRMPLVNDRGDPVPLRKGPPNRYLAADLQWPLPGVSCHIHSALPSIASLPGPPRTLMQLEMPLALPV